MKKQKSDFLEKKITRKEAIKKTGYMAVSTATMMILLNKKAHARGTGSSGSSPSAPSSYQTSGGPTGSHRR